MTEVDLNANPGPGVGRREDPVFIAVSLKMYFDPAGTVRWSKAVADLASNHPAITQGRLVLTVFPSLTALSPVLDVFQGTAVQVGAQDMFYEDRGPVTGGVSGSDLAGIGCTHVVVGHAERRSLFAEDDRTINLKVHAAWRNGLTPLLCVGEDQPGTPGQAAATCIAQLDGALFGAESDAVDRRLVVAYEPTWAIGGRQPADIGYIQSVARELRGWLDKRGAFAGARLIYGGSAGAGLLHRLDGAVDGLFLGRFAHSVPTLRSLCDEIIRPR